MIHGNVYLSEFVGTTILITLGNGVMAGCFLNKGKSQGAGWIAIAAGWSFALMMAAYTTGWVSGAHLNPAVTIGLASSGLFPLKLVPGYIIAQMLGAMFGQLLVYLVYKVHYDVTENQGAILATHCTSPSVRNFKWNLLTSILMTTVLVIGANAIGHINNRAVEFVTARGVVSGHIGVVKPMVAGFYFWVIGMTLGGPIGYAMNPARDLGPRIMHAILPIKHKGGNDWGYAWIPVVGPLLGAITGAFLFKGIFH